MRNESQDRASAKKSDDIDDVFMKKGLTGTDKRRACRTTLSLTLVLFFFFFFIRISSSLFLLRSPAKLNTTKFIFPHLLFLPFNISYR